MTHTALSSFHGETADGAFHSTDTPRDRAAQLTVAGALVAAITHDLRQPLTALEMNISAALHLLQGSAPQIDEALEALHDALVQQGRMRESLQVLHDLAAHREPNCEHVDLEPIVRGVAALVATEVVARQASLLIDVPASLPRVFADGSLVRQALLNIVLNALAAASLSTGAERTITLTARPVDGAVELAVSHYGPRADPADDDWGLALARSVIEAHHGAISTQEDADAGVHLVTRWPTTPHPSSPEESHA
jgi:signal transduction histidine kinase